MDVLEGIVVCSNEIKKEIILKNPLKDYTFFSIDNLNKKLGFDYELRALYELSKEFNIPYSHTFNYVKYMEFVNKEYDDLLLNKIYLMKQFLIKNNLVVDNTNFYNYIKQKNITFIDCDDSLVVSNLKKKLNPIVINTMYQKRNLDIRKYTTANDEVRGLFSHVKKLLNEGISINDIIIVNAGEEYDFYLKRLSSMYNIKVNFKPKKNILSINIVKYFLSMLDNYDNFFDIINELKLKYNNSSYLNKIVNLINDNLGYMYKPSELKECFIDSFKKMSYETKRYDNALNILDFDTYFDSDKHVFFLGFNEQKAYEIKKDTDFLSDIQKSILGVDTSSIKTLVNKENLLKNIYKTKNIYLSYKLQSSFQTDEPQSLIKEENMKVINEDYLFGFNKKEDDLVLCTDLDNYLNYNVLTTRLTKYYHNNLSYNTFSNVYNLVNESIGNKLNLSYSKMKVYYNCKFAFYLKYILKVEDYEEIIEAKIGQFVHYMFEKCKSVDDIDFYYNEFINSNNYSFKEVYYFKQFLDVIKQTIIFNNEHEDISSLGNTLCEQKFDLKFFDDNLLFTGIIDKVKYQEIDGITYASIIDYKTGNDKVSLDNLSDGQNMQLPIYMYMLRKSKMFNDLKIIGYYLQNIEIDSEDFAKSSKLKGYTKDELSLIAKFDPKIEKNSYIQSLKMTKSKEFSKNSKLVNEQLEDEIYNTVDKLIKDAYEGIINKDFKINPKKRNEYNISCTYCKFSDVCFKTHKDLEELKSGCSDEME